jgi:serine/threonine-protein kinase
MNVPEPPSPARWRRVQQLFHAALERPDAERAAWLAGAEGDAALRAEVAALLAADAEPATLLDRAPAALAGLDAPAPGPPAAPADGATLGPYRVVRTLGQGGMGVVFLARDERTGDAVALKVLRPAVADALAQESARRRFLREVRVGERATHPALVPVLDSGESDGRLWLAMPYVDGETLRARLRREPRLPLAPAADVGRQLAEALAWLAERGVVHRDVKPDNVLLSADAGGALRVRLADFGVARALDLADADGRLTATGVLVGTVRYMSPEQIRGERVDAAADVFALGAVLYELLAGEPPFGGAERRALLRGAPDAAPDVRRARADVPADVAALIQRALAPAAAARPSAAAVATALAAASARV